MGRWVSWVSRVPGSPSRMTSWADSKLTIDMLSAIKPTCEQRTKDGHPPYGSLSQHAAGWGPCVADEKRSQARQLGEHAHLILGVSAKCFRGGHRRRQQPFRLPRVDGAGEQLADALTAPRHRVATVTDRTKHEEIISESIAKNSHTLTVLTVKTYDCRPVV